VDPKPDLEEDIQTAPDTVTEPPRALGALAKASIDVRAVRADATGRPRPSTWPRGSTSR
jgi:hypothetical protein